MTACLPAQDSLKPMDAGLHIGIDVGGTFTDVSVHVPGAERPILFKLPSTPGAPDEAIIEGIRQVLRLADALPTAVHRISHGTTVGTNALIQRRVGKVGVVTTEGFRDLLEIGRQTRPRVYDIHSDHPKPLAPRALRQEVRERILADGTVHKPLEIDDVIGAARHLSAEGVDSVVVCFLNAYAYPVHESQAAEVLSRHLPPHVHVVTSSEIYPEFREYERFSTAVLNAALFTVMNAYLDRFAAGTETLGVRAPPEVSQSVGGLMSIAMARRVPLRCSLSGPAAGVIGAASRAVTAQLRDVVTLDMGGTSADVSLLVDGRPAEVQDRMLAGFPLRMPALDVNAVGAGGGSIAWIDRDGLLKVGPQSAGATPGPACYGQGGTEATVTDANVVLGRLNPGGLLDGSMPLDPEAAYRAITALAEPLGLGVEETALGIVQVTSAVMVKAIRSISVERGHDPGSFSLLAFGGAGPLHATEVARELDITRILIPPNPGILCAEGLLQSDLRGDFVRSVLKPMTLANATHFVTVRDALDALCQGWFSDEAIPPQAQSISWAADMRYVGQNFELTLPLAAPAAQSGETAFHRAHIDGLSRAFHQAHETTYGFASPDEPIELVALRATTLGRLPSPPPVPGRAGAPASPVGQRTVRFAPTSGREPAPWDTPIYERQSLTINQVIEGPAIVEQLDTTVVVHPGDSAAVDDWGNLVISL